MKRGDHPNSISENRWGIFTYETADAIVVSIQVPHTLGDYAKIRLDEKSNSQRQSCRQLGTKLSILAAA